MKVIENAILSRAQIINVPIGHYSHRIHCPAKLLGSTPEIYKENTAELGHISMFGHIRNPDTQVTTPLVNVKLTELKHCPYTRSARIKISEQHEILQETIKIAIITHQFFHVIDGIRFRLHCHITGHKFQQVSTIAIS